MTNDTDTTAANADAANNSESSRAAAVIEPSNGLWERAAAVLRQQVSKPCGFPRSATSSSSAIRQEKWVEP